MTESSTKKYAFVLGRERDLCLAELKAVLARFCFGFDLLSVADNIAFINIEAETGKIAKLAEILGGTVKIYEIIGDPADIKSAMLDYISKYFRDKGKVTFGLSAYLATHLNITLRAVNQLGFQTKNELKKDYNISSRYIELRESTEVSTILSLKEKLIGKGVEFGLFPHAFGVLVGLSNPEEWSKRDYDKPAGDKKSGMLPPKLARMMINLALGTSNNQHPTTIQQPMPNNHLEIENSNIENSLKIGNCKLEIDERTLVTDPFCGSGNLLLEAMVLGVDAFGSDNSEKAVSDSRKNIEWLHRNQKIDSKVEVIGSDATGKELIDSLQTKYVSHYTNLAVVTEPYLGEPKKYKPTLNAAKGEYDKVKELYLDFFRNFAALESNKLPIVFCVVFPLVETIEGKFYSLYRESVDEIRKIGYTELRSPLVYGRDYQVVKREIVLLELNS